MLTCAVKLFEWLLTPGEHYINMANLPLLACLKTNVQFHNLPCRVHHSISNFRSESLRVRLCPHIQLAYCPAKQQPFSFESHIALLEPFNYEIGAIIN